MAYMSSIKDRFGIENTHAVLYFLFSYVFPLYSTSKGTIMEISWAWSFNDIPATVIRGVYLYVFNIKYCIEPIFML